MEWSVAGDIVDDLKKQGRFDSLRRHLEQLCEQKGIFNDVKYAMRQMLKEEYESILRKSKIHPAMELKVTNKRVLGEELSAIIEKRFPWATLRKDIIHVFLTSTGFRAELDRYIDETLDVWMEKQSSLEAETGISSGVSSTRNSGSTKKTFKMESLLDELFGSNDSEKASTTEALDFMTVNTQELGGESTLDLPEIDLSMNDFDLEEGELEEGEVLPYDDTSSSIIPECEKCHDKLAIGKSVAAKIPIIPGHSRWIYARIIGTNVDQIRVVAISLIESQHPEWSIKEWTIVPKHIVCLPDLTDLNMISMHMSRMKRAQDTGEAIMAVYVDAADRIAHMFRPVHLIFSPEDWNVPDPLLTVEAIETNIRYLVPANQCIILSSCK